MECKDFRTYHRGTYSGVLIETLWNVKSHGDSPFNLRSSVLIETLWNVKEYELDEAEQRNIVLIETLWNVKLFVANDVADWIEY